MFSSYLKMKHVLSGLVQCAQRRRMLIILYCLSNYTEYGKGNNEGHYVEYYHRLRIPKKRAPWLGTVSRNSEIFNVNILAEKGGNM